jgi:hypothetical protein
VAHALKAAAGLLATAMVLISACGNARHAGHDPASFRSVLAALQSDMRKANSDLRGEAKDIRRGTASPAGPCYSLFNNVNYDVVQRLDRDAAGGAVLDRNSLSSDIAQMKMDIKTLQEDVRDFQNDAVAHVSREKRAVASLRRIIARTRRTADEYIAQVNADVSTGYQLAGQFWRQHRCPAGDQIGTPAVQVPLV